MPIYNIHHISRNVGVETQKNGPKLYISVVFFPKIRDAATKAPNTVQADDEIAALAAAKRRFPFLGSSIAVSPQDDNTLEPHPYNASRVY